MIQRTVAATLPSPARLRAASAATRAASAATRAVPTPSLSIARQAAAPTVPAESLWYRIKRSIINVLSNFNYNKRSVHAVTAEMAARVQPNLRPGDILLRRTEGTSGNFFIPSWWKHAGVYVGNDQVVDATFHGIQKRSFASFMTEGDQVMIVRAKNLTADQRQSIANYANHQVGKPYDFDFDFVDETRQSCTELADHAVRNGAGKGLVEKNWIGSVTGDSFKNANFDLVWTSQPDKSVWSR